MSKSKKDQTPVGYSSSAGLSANIGQLCSSIRTLEAEKMAKLLTRLTAIEALVFEAEKK
ncbi:hypothetical protein [Coralliovum pocilloporae]|uniref:hypothetical protein n=1 Tax=Coralliovum pocilloporae TaxID=3066369 RepID=UPI003306CFA6